MLSSHMMDVLTKARRVVSKNFSVGIASSSSNEAISLPSSPRDVQETEVPQRERFAPLRGSTTLIVASSHGPVCGDRESKGKSPKIMEAMEVDDEDAVEIDDADLKDDVPDYYSSSLPKQESKFNQYIQEEDRAPLDVLLLSSIASSSIAKRTTKQLGFPGPYSFKALGLKERICFPREGEVGVYCDFFTEGICFPLNKDMENTLTYYALPRCQCSPTSIRSMISFLSLTFHLGVPFSIPVFRYLY